MPEKEPQKKQRIEPREITDELKESYLDYAMSVIVSRALPDVRDGLKPVQRRILWAMWSMGQTAGARFMKSARITGEILGKYHPHGDTAVYDAMVRMAQDFSLRYPLVKGQGNFGSIDGDSAAHMRYTESKLEKIAEELLFDIEKGTVDWQPNYDSSRTEPKYLPAKLPNLLINGTVGIAVGMATSIPPHNLSEVIDATTFLIEKPDATIKDLMQFIPGPDFPTGGIIYGTRALEEAYTTGRGSITTRGVLDIQEQKNGRFQIIISEIPYQVNKSDLIIKMAELVTDKKIEGIKDIRDESDREGLRIAIDLKGDTAPQKIVNRLYQYTDLQKNIHYNMIALEGGIQPQMWSLKGILQAHIDHRNIVVRRRTEFDLKKAEERAHILEGLVKALDVIDKVIATIRKSKDKINAHANLMKTFKFTDAQTTAILEMRLHTLAALERKKLEDELVEKKKLIAELKAILKSPKRILAIIKNEFAELRKQFGGERKTKAIKGGIKEFNEEDLVPQEEAVITLTRGGYIKRMPPSTFKAQKRGGKGLIGFELKDEDQITSFIFAHTHDNILFFTNRGRVFLTKGYDVPAASRTARGKTVYNFLEIPPEEHVTAMRAYTVDKEGEAKERNLVMVTARGLVKKTALKDFDNVRRTGIIAINLRQDDELRWVSLAEAQEEIIVASAFGQSIRFKESDARAMGRTAAGVTAIRLKDKDEVAGVGIIKKQEAGKFLIVMANGYAKQTPLKEYKTQNRGGSGMRTAKVTQKTGHIIAARIVGVETEEMIAFSKKGQVIRTKIADVRTTGRDAQGVKIMNLKEGDTLVGVVCL